MDAEILNHPTGFALAAHDLLQAMALEGPNFSLVAPQWRKQDEWSLLSLYYAAGTVLAAFTCVPKKARCSGKRLVF